MARKPPVTSPATEEHEAAGTRCGGAWARWTTSARRFAQDLHDHVGQTMVALVIRLDLLRCRLETADAATAEALDQLSDIAKRGRDEVHRLVHNLRPLILDDRGLYAALWAYVETNLRPAGMEVDLRLAGPENSLSRDL